MSKYIDVIPERNPARAFGGAAGALPRSPNIHRLRGRDHIGMPIVVLMSVAPPGALPATKHPSAEAARGVPSLARRKPRIAVSDCPLS
jgi:hypothetical protein